MTWRLVLGVIALQWRLILSPLVMVTLVSRSDNMPGWLAGGLALLFVVATGATTNSALSQRALVVLPVGPKELNQATWVLAVLLPLAMLTIGRGVAASVNAAFADQWSWVYPASSIRVFYECLFLALVGVWAVGVPDRHEPDYRADPRLWLKLSAMLGTAAIPFLAIPFLPSSFAAITPLGWLITAVLAAIASIPVIWMPTQYRRPSPAVVVEQEPPAPKAGSITSAPVTPARFKGVWALLPGVIAQAAGLAALFIVFQLSIQWSKPSQTLLQPFDPGMSAARFVWTICPLILMFIGMLPGLGSKIPTLKLLPLPSRRAAAALTLAPAVTPLVFWGALLLIHVAVSMSWPGTLRAEYLIALMGLAALVDALGIKAGSPLIKFAIGAPLVLALTYATDIDKAQAELLLRHWLVPMIGLVSVALAYFVNLHTMTRSPRASRAYRYGRIGAPQGAR